MTFISYNVTKILAGQGTTNPYTNFLKGVRADTNYIPGMVILIIIFVIIMLVLKAKGTDTTAAFTAASLVNVTLAILFYAIPIITVKALIFSIFLLPVSVLLLYWMAD